MKIYRTLSVIILLQAFIAHAAPVDNFIRTQSAAIYGHNYEHLVNVSVEQCADACLDVTRSNWCLSFDYYKNSRECDLSDKRADDVGGLKTDYDGHPYDHYSLGFDSLKQFKRTANAAISGHNVEHLTNVSEGQCADACNNVSRPWCRSFDYYKHTNKCDLSGQQAEDVGGLTSTYDYDHFSRILETLDGFTKTEDAAISGHNIEQLTEVTPEECAIACADSQRHVWCRSFDYYKNENKCDLSNKNANEVGGLKTDYPDNPYDHYSKNIEKPKPNPIPGKKHILLIGLDGLRGDSIQCSTCADTVHMDALINGGAFHNNLLAGGPQVTVSGPGWSSVFTGFWDDDHGVVSNSTNLMLQKPHVFDVIKQVYPTASTAVVADWVNLTTNLSPTYANYVVKNENKNSQQATDQVIEWLNWENAPTAIFYYLHNTDIHAHSYDPHNRFYQANIESEDKQIGQVLTALTNRPNYQNEEWLIVVTSDHGGLGTGHGGQSAQERNTFLILNNNYQNPTKTAYCTGDLSSESMLQIDGAAPHILDFLKIEVNTAGQIHHRCGANEQP